MLWLDAFGTPKNPGGGIEVSNTKFYPPPSFSMHLNRRRVIFLFFCIVGPIGHFWS